MSQHKVSQSKPQPGKAIVIGGSLGGLFAGNMLRSMGWDVHIYERSTHDLDSRGGGIVLQPDVVEVFRRSGIDIASIDLGVDSSYRTVFNPDGSIQSQHPARQTQTSWSLIYTTMKNTFGDTYYHKGKKLIAIQQDKTTAQVNARFDDGSEASGDLLIGADGNGSTVRQLLWPDAKPTYAGYLAWRGLVRERDIPAVAADGLVGDFAFANNKGSHMLGYLVPGDNNDTREGHRYYNWVWYRVAGDAQLKDIMTDKAGNYRGFSIPEGKLTERWRAHVYSEAEIFLPPNFAAMVNATAEPFGQAIRDLTVDRMVNGRVILLGDAAFIPRPHTAASTAKAAANAIALAEALKRFPDNIDQALLAWEPQQLSLGKHLYRQGTETGNYLLFHH
ncbi:2-polyprenyl-6-methoxyphenol hydroxylase [Exilibacterium tricleocarpae]|uniref:2-polyprenyl-6-methoxyphenol hydroxylase n=1 Tax=Exilibacterium tricleocarpae TaxID=2591008 RepID=A0A545T0S2_9GAMM|nr:FAD binding domain-containing protein [Exilibacterium tricleocarpae]TQV70779.1 2-polyprenyl-6-methoxyphenol hydroxylase [Exilibacterium tricleocarpae]